MLGSLEQPPIIVRGRRWQWPRAPFLLFPVLFVSLLVFELRVPALRTDPTTYLQLVLFGMLTALGVWGLVSPARLEISPSGVQLRITWRNRRLAWSEVSDFRPVRFNGREAVGFDYAGSDKGRWGFS